MATVPLNSVRRVLEYGIRVEHVVWFDDARSMNAKLRLISEYGLRGGGIWQIMNFFPAMSMIINQLYNVDKEV